MCLNSAPEGGNKPHREEGEEEAEEEGEEEQSGLLDGREKNQKTRV